jgi:hypothetical protein
MGRSEHTFGENDLWCTPPEVFEPVLKALQLDHFGLDPFGNPLSIVPAKEIVLLPEYTRDVLALVVDVLKANHNFKDPDGTKIAALQDSVRERYDEFLAMTKRLDSTVYWGDAYVPHTERNGRAWTADWSGRGAVFCNGPTSDCGRWAEKAASETGGDENVGLWPARTGANYFRDYIATCDALLWWNGRVKFRGAKDPAPWHSVISYIGPRADQFLDGMEEYGWSSRNVRDWG